MAVEAVVEAEDTEVVRDEEMVWIGIAMIHFIPDQTTMGIRMAGRIAVEDMEGMAAVAAVVMAGEGEIPTLKTRINPDRIRVNLRLIHTVEGTEEVGTVVMVDMETVAAVVAVAEEVMAATVDMAATRDHREGLLKTPMEVEVEMATVHLKHLQ